MENYSITFYNNTKKGQEKRTLAPYRFFIENFLFLFFKHYAIIHDTSYMFYSPHIKGNGILALLQVLCFYVKSEEAWLAALHRTTINTCVVIGLYLTYPPIINKHLCSCPIGSAGSSNSKAQRLLWLFIKIENYIPIAVLRLGIIPVFVGTTLANSVCQVGWHFIEHTILPPMVTETEAC